jgi:hypothetical protein
MVVRNTQRVEVVVLPLDLGTFDDLEAHLAQRRKHVTQGLGDGMQAANQTMPARQRNVDGVGLELGHRLAFDLATTALERRLKVATERIGSGACGALFLRRELAEPTQNLRHGTLTAEVGDTPLVKGRRVLRFQELSQSSVTQDFEVGQRSHSSGTAT